MAIGFTTMLGQMYEVQTNGDLVAGTWLTLTNNVPGIFGIVTVTNSVLPNAQQEFYRIKTTYLSNSATDNAADAAYSGGWTNGSNGGSGFSPWVLTASTTNTSYNGFFIGTSTNNAAGGLPSIDTGGVSWGIYANSGNNTAAYRGFNSSLAVGGTFQVNMDNGYINTGNTVGFALRNGNATGSYSNYNTNERFEFFYLGGDSSNSYKVVDAGGQQNIGVGFTGTGLSLTFTLTGTNTYTLLTVNNATAATNTFSGTLKGSNTVDSIALYNRNAGGGNPYNAFFNSLQIIGP